MNQAIAHRGMRDELLLWLSGAMSDDAELEGLGGFLQDDFPYDAEHVVGLVLRQQELRPWQELMAAIESVPTSSDEAQSDKVRERAAALLAAMRS